MALLDNPTGSALAEPGLHTPLVMTLLGGGFVVIWRGEGPEGYGLYAQGFGDGAGLHTHQVKIEDDAVIGKYDTMDFHAIPLENGAFLIRWNDGFGVQERLVDGLLPLHAASLSPDTIFDTALDDGSSAEPVRHSLPSYSQATHLTLALEDHDLGLGALQHHPATK